MLGNVSHPCPTLLLGLVAWRMDNLTAIDGWMGGSDVKMVLEIEPGNKLAKESAPRLEKLQKEKMEAMKDEALGEISPNSHLMYVAVRCGAVRCGDVMGR